MTRMTARRPWAAALALALGVGALVAAGWQLSSRGAPSVVEAGDVPRGAVLIGAEPTAAAIETSGATPRTVTPIVGPNRVRIGAADVDTTVVPIGVDRAGALAVPENGEQVGWWARSQPPGANRGSTVLVGHVDTPEGPGELYHLRTVRPGDRIQVWAGDRRHRYEVKAVRSYPRPVLADSGVFDQDGVHRLVVITCGGPYDRENGGYRDNVVVYAVPA